MILKLNAHTLEFEFVAQDDEETILLNDLLKSIDFYTNYSYLLKIEYRKDNKITSLDDYYEDVFTSLIDTISFDIVHNKFNATQEAIYKKLVLLFEDYTKYLCLDNVSMTLCEKVLYTTIFVDFEYFKEDYLETN